MTYKKAFSILLTITLLMALTGCTKENLAKESQVVVTNNTDEVTVKIENTKSIDIYDVISSDSNNVVNISDPDVIKQLEGLFNKSAYTKSTESIQNPSLYVKFSSDEADLSFFVYANDMVDMDGTKYKSKEAIFDAINKVYMNQK